MSNDRYCFPEFTDSSILSGEKNATNCISFQPVFQSNTNSQQVGHSEKPINDVEFALAKACDKGFSDGYQQGASEGTCVAQSALVPGCEHLSALTNQIAELIPQIYDITVRQTANLAEAIYKRITGEKLEKSGFEINHIQNLIQKKIESYLKLYLRLNAGDLNAITGLLKNSELSLRLQQSGVVIEGDPNVQHGQFHIDTSMDNSLLTMTVEDLTDHSSK